MDGRGGREEKETTLDAARYGQREKRSEPSRSRRFAQERCCKPFDRPAPPGDMASHAMANDINPKLDSKPRNNK